MTAPELAARLDAKKTAAGQWMAKCPNHEDRTESLSIGEGAEGRVLIYCHAMCAPAAIMERLGLHLSDLMPPQTTNGATPARSTRPPPPVKTAPPVPPKPPRVWPTIEAAAHGITPPGCTLVAIYPYPHAKTGQPFAAVVRYQHPTTGKTFRQFHATIQPAPDGWQSGAPAELWPLFNLATLPATGPVYVNEGEGKTLAACTIGLPATASSGGAKGAARTDWTPLAGRNVVILPDHDAPGRAYAMDVTAILRALTPPAKVRTVELPGLQTGDDIVQFIEQRDSADADTIRREIERLSGADMDPKWRIFFNAGGKVFLVQDDRGGWVPMSEGQVKRVLRSRGVETVPARGEHISQIDHVLIKIQTSQNVEYAGPLAGFSAGVLEIGTHRVLVTDSPRLIEPRAGDWMMLRGIIDGLLGDDQTPYLFGWLKIAIDSLRAGERMPGQALAIAGPKDCGKSLLQNLITPLLGGRCCRPYQTMTGGTPFNAHLFAAEHLMIEDEAPSMDLRTRREFGAYLKNVVANQEQQCHAKGQTPLMLRPFWRLTITLNDETENLMVLPPIDASLIDKITLLKAHAQTMPMDTATIDARKMFWAALVAQLPAFAAFIAAFQIPTDLVSQRFGVKHFHHPDLLEELNALAPEHRLLSLIDGYLFDIMGTTWTGSAEELERQLTASNSDCRQEALKLFTFNTACGVYLSRLERRFPRRFTRETYAGSTRRWIIRPKSALVESTL